MSQPEIAQSVLISPGDWAERVALFRNKLPSNKAAATMCFFCMISCFLVFNWGKCPTTETKGLAQSARIITQTACSADCVKDG
jgi:hypothetical protein